VLLGLFVTLAFVGSGFRRTGDLRSEGPGEVIVALVMTEEASFFGGGGGGGGEGVYRPRW
jgi:hypothetical protein